MLLDVEVEEVIVFVRARLTVVGGPALASDLAKDDDA